MTCFHPSSTTQVAARISPSGVRYGTMSCNQMTELASGKMGALTAMGTRL